MQYKSIHHNEFLYSEEIIDYLLMGDTNFAFPESLANDILWLWERQESLTPVERTQYNLVKSILNGNDLQRKTRVMESRIANLRAIKESEK